MKPLFVLIGSFVISLSVMTLFTNIVDYYLCGRIAMSAMLMFTAVGHFVFTKGMAMMLPNAIPFKVQVIYLTGFIEIAAAAGLLIASVSAATGWMLVIFFLVLLPGNLKAANNHIDYQKGTFTGPGPQYLWFRIPLQLLFIVWTYISTIAFQ